MCIFCVSGSTQEGGCQGNLSWTGNLVFNRVIQIKKGKKIMLFSSNPCQNDTGINVYGLTSLLCHYDEGVQLPVCIPGPSCSKHH